MENEFFERRSVSDRRTRATSFWSLWRPGGRRRGFRRQGEESNEYVDHVSSRALTISLIIVLSSVVDAAVTLLHLDKGAVEVNPFMRLLLSQSVLLFVVVKSAITGFGALIFAAHQNFCVGKIGLYVVAGGYAILLLYHAELLLVPEPP